MYASWDMECDWHNFLSFWLFFYLFTPLTTTKIKIWKKCKQAWRNYPFTHVYHKWGSYHYFSCDIRCNGQLFVILGHLLPFDLPNNPKYQNFEKWKKALGYYHFTLVYHKWWSYDVWFLRYGARQIEFFVILGHFLPFYPTNNRKNQFRKIGKITWRYHHFTIVYHRWQSYGVWFLRYGARQT